MTAASDTLALDPGVRSAGSNRQPCLPDTALLVVPPVVFDPLAEESLDRAEVSIWWHVEGDHPVLLQPLAVHPQRREGIQHRLPAPGQVELWPPPQPALNQPDQAPLLALAAPSDDGQTTQPAQVPALPATPRPRILLALRRAVATRDEATVAAVIHTGRREEPDWDPTDELQRLGAVRRWGRWRRRPRFPRWLARVAHLGRARGG